MKPQWKVTLLTLFPEIFPGPLGHSILGRALEEKIWSLETVNIRDFSNDKHGTVDDTACGGGPGMVMCPDVLGGALDAAQAQEPFEKIIYFSPRGRYIDQNYVKGLAKAEKVGMICGRFEGIDQRVLDHYPIDEVSLGDFILCGGEVAALALIEATVRLLPGVVGTAASLEDESFAKGLLEYPQYTRPREWRGKKVPEVLLSGDHGRINTWRQQQMEEITRKRRPDLWMKYKEILKDS
jgi:tRNA (guanine37-N1)-methyltransferase